MKAFTPASLIRSLPLWEQAILAAILLVHTGSLVATLAFGQWATDDSVQYLTLAGNLMQNSSWSQVYAPPWLHDRQYLPAYPVFLAACGRLPAVALMVQHLLALASAALLGGLLAGSIRPQWPRLAAYGYALMPYPLLFANLLLTETLFIFLTLLTLYLLVRFQRTSNPDWLAGAVLAAALASLTKGLGVLLWGGIALALLWQCRQTRSFLRAKRLLQWGIALLPGLLLVGSWAGFQASRSGHWQLASQGHIAFWYGRAGAAVAVAENRPWRDPLLFTLADSLGTTAVPLDRLYDFGSDPPRLATARLHPAAASAGRAWLAAHPAATLELHLRALGQMLSGLGYGTAKQVFQTEWIARFSSGLQGLFNLLLAGGLLAYVRRFRRMPAWVHLAMLIAVGYVVLHMAAWADGRYRMIADPLVWAAGFHAFCGRSKKRPI